MQSDTNETNQMDAVGESLELLAAADSNEFSEFAIDSDDDDAPVVDTDVGAMKDGDIPTIEDIDLGDPLSIPIETSMEEKLGVAVEVSISAPTSTTQSTTSSGSVVALKKESVSAQEDPLSSVWNSPPTSAPQATTTTASTNSGGSLKNDSYTSTQMTTQDSTDRLPKIMNPEVTPSENGMSTFMSKTLNQTFSSTFSTLASKAANSFQDAVQSATRSTNAPPMVPSGPNHNSHSQGTAIGGVGGRPTTTPKIYSVSTNNAEQMSNEMDTATKSSLITSALGTLLPGERVITFLTHLSNVRDSSWMQTCMGINADGSMERGLVWCCVITFYRIVVFSYNESEFAQSSEITPNSASTLNGEVDECLQRMIQSASLSRIHQEVRNNYKHSSGHSHYTCQMPLASIDRVEKSSEFMSASSIGNYDSGGGMVATTGVVIHGKDNGRLIQFTTPSFGATMKMIENLNTYAFPGRRNLGYLFAFESRRAEVMNNAKNASDAQRVKSLSKPRRYDPLLEYHRMGAIQPRKYTDPNGGGVKEVLSPWCPYMKANSSYELCASYPNILFGPSSVNDGTAEGLSLLRETAAFRSGHRMQALAWASGYDGASIWRSAQPKVGLQGNRSPADEFYMKKIAECAALANSHAVANGRVPKRPSLHYLKMLTGCINESDLMLEGFGSKETLAFNEKCMLKIFDLRPKSSAMANRTAGYGYENTSHYKNVTLSFHGIGNIHAVRDSYQKLSNLCINTSVNDIQWGQLVEDTKWLSQIRLILASSWQVAFHVRYNRLPVLVHCSHGWDRTSQVSALAQLLLDPYYRTREGFSCLIEKDFLALGHPFHTRCGHGEGRDRNGSSSGQSTDEGQLAPIFIQFLDCVYQIVNQYPDYFEFNTRYLLLLSEHVYSCRFGNLLCDNEREREVSASIRQTTYCLWEYLDSNPKLINNNFVRTSSSDEYDGCLMMPLPTLLRNVTLWIDRHCMYGPKPSLQSLPSNLVTALAEGDQSLPCKDDSRIVSLQNVQEEVEKWKKIAQQKDQELSSLKAQLSTE